MVRSMPSSRYFRIANPGRTGSATPASPRSRSGRLLHWPCLPSHARRYARTVPGTLRRGWHAKLVIPWPVPINRQQLASCGRRASSGGLHIGPRHEHGRSVPERPAQRVGAERDSGPYRRGRRSCRWPGHGGQDEGDGGQDQAGQRLMAEDRDDQGRKAEGEAPGDGIGQPIAFFVPGPPRLT
jgi:hypothetical protein